MGGAENRFGHLHQTGVDRLVGFLVQVTQQPWASDLVFRSSNGDRLVQLDPSSAGTSASAFITIANGERMGWDGTGILLAILGRAEPGRVNLQQLVDLVRAVVFPRVEANLQLFGIARRAAQAGKHLELISLDVADFALAEDVLQLFI
jgi:hypothetical protein